jgi:hypothetical protein
MQHVSIIHDVTTGNAVPEGKTIAPAAPTLLWLFSAGPPVPGRSDPPDAVDPDGPGRPLPFKTSFMSAISEKRKVCTPPSESAKVMEFVSRLTTVPVV